jgi:hypothetical protein
MTAAEYRSLRESLGTQQSVAAALAVDVTTIQRREAGARKISREAEIAIRYLASFVPLRGHVRMSLLNAYGEIDNLSAVRVERI